MLRVLRLADVVEMTGLGKTQIYELEKVGEFPKRRLLSKRATGWLSEEVEAWLRARPTTDEKESDVAERLRATTREQRVLGAQRRAEAIGQRKAAQAAG